MKKIIFTIIVLLLFFASIVSAQHLKKDGTPDRRYKENRTTYSSPYSNSAYSSSSSSPSSYYSSTHLKKDGTPDRRYKAYKSYTNSSTRTYNYYPHSRSSNTSTTKSNHRTKYSYFLTRDSNGRIKRSEAAKLAFMKQTNFPHGRPGYVIDHITPLNKGGCDCPSNMQWQTIAEAKAKDKWE